jgi:hypothetical protein
METTFDKFIANNPQEKKIFDKEYNQFLLSEFVLEKMEEEHISVRTLAEKAGVSPTVIQKMRTQNAERINKGRHRHHRRVRRDGRGGEEAAAADDRYRARARDYYARA